MKHTLFLLALAFPVLAHAAPNEGNKSWSQWRGHDRDSIIKGGPQWPNGIGVSDLTPLWSVAVNESYASPVIADGKVISVASRKEKDEVVKAFEAKSGKEVWKHEWKDAMKVPFFARENGSWVRCTPAISGNAIFAGGMLDVLVKIDLKSGKEIWRIDFKEREGTQKPAFGYASSPLVDEQGDLYVQAGDAVTKIDPKSGKSIWRSLEDRRGMFSSAFSSPVIADIRGIRQVVAQTRSTLAGLDPKSGDILWSVPVEAFRGMNILTPTVIGNRVFTSTYGGGSFMFEIVKKADGSLAANQVWRDKKLEGYMSSPVVIDNHIYLHGRNQHLHCIDPASGTIAWKSKEKFGKYWSMVARENRILALDERGELIYFEASPDAFKLIDRRKVSKEPTWAHLAIDGGRIYIRGLKSLSAYRWGAVKTAAATTP